MVLFDKNAPGRRITAPNLTAHEVTIPKVKAPVGPAGDPGFARST